MLVHNALHVKDFWDKEHHDKQLSGTEIRKQTQQPVSESRNRAGDSSITILVATTIEIISNRKPKTPHMGNY